MLTILAPLFGSSARPPLLLRLRSSKTFIIITVASAVFTDVFCYGIVVPVLPFALSSRANINPSSVQTWISIFLAVYGAALLAAAPVCGWLADRSSSRQVPLLLGLLALGASTAMLCVGSDIGVLAAGRVLQGVSAAVVWVVGLALLVDTVGPEEIGQAMGYVGLSMSLGMLVAPLLGGIVFEAAGYYAVFAMAFGLIALDIALRLLMVEKKVARKWIREDECHPSEAVKAPLEGQAEDQPERDIEMDAVAPDAAEPPEAHDTASPTQADEEATPPHLTRTTTSRSAAASAAAHAPPFLARLTAALPPVLFLLSSRRICNAIWASIMQASILTAFDSTLPLYVRNTFGWGSTGAGLIFLPIVVVSFLGPVVGWASDRHGPRWYATAGYVLAAPCLILLRLVEHESLRQKVLLCALLALIGVCLTLVLTPIMAEITYAVDAKAQRRPPGFFGKNGAYAQAYSLFNMAWAGGCLLGPLLGGLVNESLGWGTMTLILGLISLATAVPTVIWTGGSIFKKVREKRARRRSSPGESEVVP